MYELDNQLILSASDLNGYLNCRHLTRLDLAYARGEITERPERDPGADLIARKGDEHEARYLEDLRSDGHEVAEITLSHEKDPKLRVEALEKAAAATEEAMRAGAEVIYQATFFRPPFRGHADFLFRVDRPSDLGDYSYEVADTKLARRTKPYFLLQLCFYSEMVEQIQGIAPENVQVILGGGEEHTYRLAEFAAYFRRIRTHFLSELESEGAFEDTYPFPVAHCEVCTWRERCDQRRIEDDHLSLVANIRRDQILKLESDGLPTLEALGALERNGTRGGIPEETFEKLRSQAALQLSHRTTGEHSVELLEPEPGRGFTRLPEPSPGDIFFDMEGDPFFENGLEYLFGVVTLEDDKPEFTAFWGRDRAEERRAFEQFIDFAVARREQDPDLHIYHYASYEITALKRLAGAHGTREEELDQLLRDEVFVDLFKVVRESMRISQPSYSIKKVEAFYREARDEEGVTDGGQSVIEFERWLDSGGAGAPGGGDQTILNAIAEYNRDDCVSTWELRDWLHLRMDDAITKFGELPAVPDEEDKEPSEESTQIRAETEELISRLLDGLPENIVEADPDQRARWLLAQLLGYHQREARPTWWLFFDRREAERQELIEDAECVAGLELDQASEPEAEKRSLVYTLNFPIQETKMRAGDEPTDPSTGSNAGTILSIDPAAGQLRLKRGPMVDQAPLPRALIPGGPYNTPEQRGALRRLARDILEKGLEVDGAYPVMRQILLGEPPRVAGLERGAEIQRGSIDLDEMKEVVRSLDASYLFIQGPPGAGKTYRGARLVVDLIDRGKRVGVAANSHKAIHNMLGEIEKVAKEEGVEFRGLKKMSSGNEESRFESNYPHDALIESTPKNPPLTDGEVGLAAGTAWHFCREEVDGAAAKLDYLFIDEAGQISLADALAMGTAARNLVLLGDPQQLPQVTQGAHPPGTAASVLEHLLGDHATVPPDRGLFLDRTWRMHPDVCAFVSEVIYEGRLESNEGCATQEIDGESHLAGTGVRWIPVEHDGRAQESPEEAAAIRDAIDELVGDTFTNADGESRSLKRADFMVVTPYNAQVRCLADALPPEVRIGTVDKFQGQEAPVVFFSMATSSGDEMPRNLAFLFSRNRLNVAISRARCLAILVCSPALLEIRCRSVKEMQLVNALCRLTEMAAG